MYHATMIGLALLLSLTPPTACEIAANPAALVSQMGKRVNITGRYQWDIHYQNIHPDGCENDMLFVALTGSASEQVNTFLTSSYPGKMFGGGTVWGTFSGVVKRSTRGFPFVLIDRVSIDTQHRMTFAD